jgi:hypothetical protein
MLTTETSSERFGHQNGREPVTIAWKERHAPTRVATISNTNQHLDGQAVTDQHDGEQISSAVPSQSLSTSPWLLNILSV